MDDLSSYIAALSGSRFDSWTEGIPQSGGKPVQEEYTEEKYLGSISGLLNVNLMTSAQIKSEWALIKTAVEEKNINSEVLGRIIGVAFSVKSTENTKTDCIMDFAKVTHPEAESLYSTLSDKVKITAGSSSSSGPSTLDVADPEDEQDDNEEGADDEHTLSRAAPYICMSLIRLINKMPESYVRSLESLKIAYGKFYGQQSSTVNSFRPPLKALRQIHQGWTSYTLCAHTVSFLLSNADKQSRERARDYGFMRFLIFQHTELMGMQTYKMTISCMAGLPSMTPGQFLRAVETPSNTNLLTEISNIANGLDNYNKAHKDYYWRYCKYVNPNFFVNFSISRNLEFGYTLAAILSRRGLAGNSEYANPRNIAAFEGIKRNSTLMEKLEYRAELFDMLYAMLEGSNTEKAGVLIMMENRMVPTPRAQKRSAIARDPPGRQSKEARKSTQAPSTSQNVGEIMEETPSAPPPPPPPPPSANPSAAADALAQLLS